MGEYTDLIQTVALTLGVAWASGINLYAGFWASLTDPVLFLLALLLFLTLLCFLLPKLARGVSAVFRKLGCWLGQTHEDRLPAA